MNEDKVKEAECAEAEKACEQEAGNKEEKCCKGESKAGCEGHGGHGDGEGCCGHDGHGHGEGHGKGCGKHDGHGKGCCKEAEAETSEEDEALNTKYLRLMADFQNFRRRTEKEKSDIYAFANEKIVKELLDVIDNFERALAAGNDGDKFLEGMEMILKQLQAVLERAGVTEIECLGLDFDPNFHNAVMTEDSTEYESGKVTEVLQKGYVLNGRVVRAAMVKVSN